MKNMKLATWDGLIWYPQVYDADTTIGLDNTGFLKFDMDIEMGDKNVFNTTGSKLWQKVVLLFQNELQEQYAIMRQGRFTVDNIMKYLYGEQISQIPATFYNKDMQTKYLNYGSSYLYALHGSGEQHIRKWIRERLMYCDTLLGYRASSSDYITIRSSKLGEVYLDIETYIPMYVSVKWRDEANNTGLQTKRVGRGEKVRFTYNMPTATDQEIIVYAGYYLKSLGDVSNLQPTSMLIANASRLTEIECHSPNLINTDLSECTKLQRIDLSDCTALGTGIGAQPILNIQKCNYLRYCNCLNTQLTAIYTMQQGGNLEEIYYPETTQVVQLTNQTYLHTVGIPCGTHTLVNGNTGYIESTLTKFTTDFIKIDNTKTYKFLVNYKITNISGRYPYCVVNAYAYDENYNAVTSDNKSYQGNWHEGGTFPEKGYNSGNGLDWTFSESTKYVKIEFESGQFDGINNSQDITMEQVKRYVLFTDADNFRKNYSVKNLATVQISNCNAIKYLQYPYWSDDPINFDSLKYVQNLNITNSLSGLKSMSFSGFDKMRNVTLSSLHELENIGFEDMLPVSTTSTLKNITISDCPLIDKVSFNVSSEDYKVAFATGGTVDLGGVQSLKTIECNTSIKGLKTLVVPTSLKELKFSTEYGDGINDITNIWSANAVHNGDGFEGVDFLDMSIEYIDMLGLSKVTNGINFNISPVTQHPNLNTSRDGSDTKPYFRPTGIINLNNYTGDMTEMLKGIDLSKFTVEIDVNKDQTNLTKLFYGSVGCDSDKVSHILSKFPKANIRDYMFAYSDIPAPLELPTNIKNLSAKGMFKGTSITTDLDLPTTNLVAVDEMFMDCVGITTTHENWNKTYPSGFTSTDCYKGIGGDLDEIPVAWGGYGFSKNVTSIIVVEIPNDNYEMSTYGGGGNVHLDDGLVKWGDGSTTSLYDTHTYSTAGTYIIKCKINKNGLMFSGKLKQTAIEIKQLAPSIVGDGNYSGTLSNYNRLTKVTAYNLAPTNCTNMFQNCTSLTELVGLDTWDMSKCTGINGMFQNAGITDVTPVYDMLSTFTGSSAEYLFHGSKIESIELGRFPSSITRFVYAFSNCTNLKTIDFTGASHNVISWSYSFSGSNKVTSLISLETLNAPDGVDLTNMFNSCLNNIEEIDLSGLTCKVGHPTRFNNNGNKLKTIKIAWDWINVTGRPDYFLADFNSLENIEWGTNIKINIDGLWQVSRHNKLTVQSLLNLFNALYDFASEGDRNTHTCLIGPTNLAKLTDEQIAIATNKGWTVS